MQLSGPNRFARQGIEECEGAPLPVPLEWLEGHLPIELELHHTNLVALELRRRHMLQRFRFDLELQRRNRSRRGRGTDLHEVGATGEQGYIARPHDRRLELVSL